MNIYFIEKFNDKKKNLTYQIGGKMGAPSVKYVEDTVRGKLVEMINEIIREENLPLATADAQVEKILPDGTSRKFLDIVIWKTALVSPACQIELKDPTKGWSPFDLALVEDAEQKANLPPTSPFYATWNINELVLWKTYEEGALSWEDKRKAIYKFVKIKELRDVNDPEVKTKIKDVLRAFLNDLVQFLESKKELPTIPIDEFFINSLGTIVDASYYPIALKTREEFKKDKKFKENLTKWFVSQGWIAPVTEDIDAFEKVARQFLYLLLNKIMFYNTLRKNFPSLEPIKIKDEIEEGETLKKDLQRYFEKAEEVTKDFEAIFSYDFLERIPIPKEVVPSLKSFINGFSKYDFSKLGYKDIGHIFDRLIPNDERHKLGQYFTDPDVVDIINAFCIKTPNDKIADFGCGAGTFLVRAYARIKYLSPNRQHGEILKQLIGVDISKFAAHLTMINLTSRDLSKIENPIVICKDFFDISPSIYKNWGEIPGESLKKEYIKVEIPAELDAVVGNPPYTRQEEIEEYVTKYKTKLLQKIKSEWGFSLGKRSGIYVYFMLHGIKFLKEGGRIGYITSNSWLDTDYGRYLQEFLLKNTKIIAIIESKVERWFEDADINTAITIAEKCNKENERNNNIVKFVQLKKRLEDIIPTTNENERWKAIDELTKLIEGINEYYEDERIRIFIKTQKELWAEGWNDEENKYEGSKWDKYIRAPEIFFKILEKGKDIFVPLGSCIYGIKTGNNDFFIPDKKYFIISKENEYYLIKDKKSNKTIFKIRKKFIVPVAESPQSYSKILINNLKHLVYITKERIPTKSDNIIGYLRWGENERFNTTETCKKREIWYLQPKVPPSHIIIPKSRFDSFRVFYSPVKIYYTDSFNGVLGFFGKKEYAKITAAILNSTMYYLILELHSRTVLGQGATSLMKYEMEKIPMINYKKTSNKVLQRLENTFNEICKRDIESVFEEIGASSSDEVSLDKVKPDRRELDKIIMGDILGLTEEEQLEVYRAVIRLVKERIEKAKSVEKGVGKKKVYIEKIADAILKEVDINKLKKFPDEYLISNIEIEKIIKLPEGEAKIGRDLFGYFAEIGKKKIKCNSKEEAEWIYYSALFKNKEVKLPKDKLLMKDILENFEKVYFSVVNEIKGKLESYVPKSKLRERIKTIIEKRIGIKLT